jgi:hypothetical protein
MATPPSLPTGLGDLTDEQRASLQARQQLEMSDNERRANAGIQVACSRPGICILV